jgi:SMC interacting uncharacterized protein involved in chromosome segregation
VDDDDELLSLPRRLSNQLQAQEGKLIGLSIRMDNVEKDVNGIRLASATTEQLTNAVTLLTVKLENLHNDLEPIKRGIYWAVSLTLSAVLLALISLVITRAP